MLGRSSSWGLKTVKNKPNPFSEAIADFVEDLKHTEDGKSLFNQEVLLEAERLKHSDTSLEDSGLGAKALSNFVEKLDVQQRRRSNTRRITTWLSPLVDGLTQYSAVIDTMVQADPTFSGLIWGGAKLVLQLATGFVEYFDQILDTLADIGRSLKVFHVYSAVYSWNYDMNVILVESYKNILLFWQSTSKLLTRNGLKTMFSGVLRPFKSNWANYKAKLEKDVRFVNMYAQATQAIASQKHEAAVAKEQEDSNRERIIRWMNASDDSSAVDMRIDLQKRLSSKYHGTCEWLYTKSAFLEWLKSNENDSLWMNANPGAGKSVTCSALIETLQKSRLKVAYFFCSYSEPSKRKTISMLRCLTIQLLRLVPAVPDDLLGLYREEVRQGQLSLNNVEIAVKAIKALLKRIDRVHIVVDGLDECVDRDVAIECLGLLVPAKSHGIVKWFYSSRNEPDFKDLAKSISKSIEVTAEITKQDIEKVLREDPDIAAEGKEKIEYWKEASEGNFLWMHLTLETMKNSICEEDAEEDLKEYQPGLTACYLRSLQSLLSKPERLQQLAKKIFRFVVLSAQPLTFNELCDALAVREKAHDFSPRRIPKEDLIEALCRPLIVLDRVNDYLNPTLRLAHKTVRDFFIQDPDNLGTNQDCKQFLVNDTSDRLELGKACLTYLSYSRYEKPIDLDHFASLKDHAFLVYAALFWHVHLENIHHTEELFDIVDKFMRSPNYWTCMQVQSKFAPYSFACLTGAGSSEYKMQNPSVFPADEEFYAEPLPGWLDEYGKRGHLLVHDNQRQVKEWRHVLSRHPEHVWQCHPGVSGRQSFFSTKVPNQRQVYVSALTTADGAHSNGINRCEEDNERSVVALSLFEAKETGVKASHVDIDPAKRHTGISSTEWRVEGLKDSIREADSTWNIDYEQGEKHVMWNTVALTTEQKFTLWVLDIKSYSVHCISKDKVRVPVKIPDDLLKFITSDPASVKTHSQAFFLGGKTVLLINFRRVTSRVAEVDGTDSENEDSKKPKDEKTLTHNLMIVIDEDDEACLAHYWKSQSSDLWIAEPASHPRCPVLVWSKNATTILVGDHSSGKISELSLPSTLTNATPTQKDLVTKGYHFSTSGSHIYEAAIHMQKQTYMTLWTITLTTYPITLSSSSSSSAQSINIRPPEILPLTASWGSANSPSTDQLIATCRASTHPYSYYWSEGYLLVCFGCHELTMYHFPLVPGDESQRSKVPRDQQENEDEEEERRIISTLPTPIFLPSSTVKRPPMTFFPYTDSSSPLQSSPPDYLTFCLPSVATFGPVPVPVTIPDPNTSSNSNSNSNSSFDFHCPPDTYPALIIHRGISALGGWVPYREKPESEWVREWETTKMKGEYLAREMKFSVPIRSGLGAGGRVLVTCW